MTTHASAVDPTSGRRTDGAPDLDRLGLLTDLQASFAAGIAGADSAAPVPACGKWRVADLVVHLGRIHHWAAGQARRQQETPLGRGPFDLGPFYTAQAAELRGTLADLGPDATSWTLLGNGPASFWHRRQLHETLVHLHDLRAAALGSAEAVARERPIDVPAPVWADTVDEVVRMFQPRQVRLGRMEPLPATVRLMAADTGDTWTLGGQDADRPASDAPSATLTATAHDLALVLWGRRPLAGTDVDVAGDPAAVDAALAARIVP
ncbi:maleylpyruvate isomerase family mycothiol-dependent enzyme [Isoptericola aurantiacus]|uniref:maleylpyruvate isomerase family mycothiol-dependent enzyme n=1 Tax=Isoptericola aurantiacus TaxID=3377839 RepID=UPI00383AAD8E